MSTQPQSSKLEFHKLISYDTTCLVLRNVQCFEFFSFPLGLSNLAIHTFAVLTRLVRHGTHLADRNID